jgi:adenylate cyclase
MAYFLIAQPNTAQEKSHQLKSGNNRIGRSPDNDIVVLHGSLSRYHAQLKITGDQFILSDLGSLNGTFVNGVKVNQGEDKKLKNGDQLTCGNVVFQFVAKPDQLSQPPQAPQISPPEHFSIIKQIAPEQSRIVMGDILDQGKKGYSVLKLRGQSSEERTVDKLKILLEVTKQLICPRNSEKLLDKILDLLMEIMNIDRAVLLMRDHHTGKLERKALKVGEDIECEINFFIKRVSKPNGFLHSSVIEIIFSGS